MLLTIFPKTDSGMNGSVLFPVVQSKVNVQLLLERSFAAMFLAGEPALTAERGPHHLYYLMGHRVHYACGHLAG